METTTAVRLPYCACSFCVCDTELTCYAELHREFDENVL